MMSTHILSSVGRVILASIIGLPAGIALGILAGMSRPVSKVLEPIGVFANSISGIAWIPLAIVWFGVGWMTTLFIMLNTIFWLMFFNAMLGVRSIAKVYEQSVLTMGGGRWDVITNVYLPGAMPSIISGMRMAMGFGWRALIAAEMIGGDSGLGFMIFSSASEFKIEEVFLGVIIISLIFLATDRYFLMPLEKWTVHRWGLVWKPH
jgi:NitT/TauT family transport system permease protein/taurine transport system permease protein